MFDFGSFFVVVFYGILIGYVCCYFGWNFFSDDLMNFVIVFLINVFELIIESFDDVI